MKHFITDNRLPSKTRDKIELNFLAIWFPDEYSFVELDREDEENMKKWLNEKYKRNPK